MFKFDHVKLFAMDFFYRGECESNNLFIKLIRNIRDWIRN